MVWTREFSKICVFQKLRCLWEFQSETLYALGTRTKFRLQILTMNVNSGIVYFREIILESLQNVSEKKPW